MKWLLFSHLLAPNEMVLYVASKGSFMPLGAGRHCSPWLGVIKFHQIQLMKFLAAVCDCLRPLSLDEIK